MENALHVSSNLQLIYNVIHWAIGTLLIIFALLEYRARRNKDSLLASAVFTAGSVVISFSLLAGYAYYFHGWHWPWQLNGEQSVHILIGVVWLTGGLLTLLSKAKVLPRLAVYGIPAALAFGGVKFMIPHQHGADGIQYGIIYHLILGASLAGAAIAVAFAYSNKEIGRLLARIILGATILPGIILFAYQHPASYWAECRSTGATHRIDVSKPNQGDIKVGLCDKIELYSTGDRNYAPALGDHHAHTSYPGFEVATVNREASNSFTLTRSGEYKVHDHNSQGLIAKLIIIKPAGSESWPTYPY